MSVWRVFRQGLTSNFTSVPRIVVLICIIIVPTLYPLFYLQAFWDPYGNVKNLPVVLVNQDHAAGPVDLGADLATTLPASGTADWHVTSLADADAGLADKTYYAEFIIPSDFSSDLAQGRQTHIELRTNSKNSFMSSLLAQQIENKMQQTIGQQVTHNYVASLLEASPDGKAAANFVSDPITPVITDVNPVPNYGTGFAPYFLSLSGWIGALLISMTVGNRLSHASAPAGPVASVLGRYATCAVIGAVQAALLVGVIALLGIAPGNWLGLFGVLLVGSWASIAIVSTLVNLLGRLGQLCAMILLVFQLTCSGGTFPTPLTNGMFFTDAHPYVSFTYSINALREVISAQSIDAGVLWSSIGWLVVYIVVALAVACALQPVINRFERKLLARRRQKQQAGAGAPASAEKIPAAVAS